jgi:hypothetical protein
MPTQAGVFWDGPKLDTAPLEVGCGLRSRQPSLVPDPASIIERTTIFISGALRRQKRNVLRIYQRLIAIPGIGS